MRRAWWVTLLALWMWAVPAGAAPRYFTNTIWLDLHGNQGFARMREMVQASRQRGCNAISFDVSWAGERPDGSYDFALADRLADEVTSRGMHLFVRLNTSLLRGGRLRWMDDSMLMQTPTGRVLTRNSPREVVPSITHRIVQRKMAQFYTAAAAHFAERARRPGGAPVVCFSAAFNLTMESEYTGNGDYSPSARQAFLDWAEGQARGRELKALNQAWGTKFAQFRDLTLTGAPEPLRQQFYTHTLDELFTLLSHALKQGDPQAKFGVQFGCLWDVPRRRSMTVDLRSPAIDWVFVADAPTYNFPFTVDMLRTAARGKAIANEIDGPIRNMTDERARRQGLMTLAHEADAIFMCNWRLEPFTDRAQWTFPEEVGRAVRQPAPVLNPRRALYVSNWDLIGLTGRPEDYQKEYDRLTRSGEEAIDVLTDGAVLADAARLGGYDEIVLPANRTIARAARAVLERLPRGKLKILNPKEAGMLDEFGILCPPLGAPPSAPGIAKP